MNEDDRRFIESLFAKQAEETGHRIAKQAEETERKIGKQLEEAVSHLAAFMMERTEETERRFDSMDERLQETERRINVRMDERLQETESRIDARMDKRLQETEGRINARVDERLQESEHRLTALMETMEHKIDLVAEGQQILVERIDRFEHEVKEEFVKLDRRVTVLAADLAVHKADPHAHKGVYRVKEEHEEFGNQD